MFDRARTTPVPASSKPLTATRPGVARRARPRSALGLRGNGRCACGAGEWPCSRHAGAPQGLPRCAGSAEGSSGRRQGPWGSAAQCARAATRRRAERSRAHVPLPAVPMPPPNPLPNRHARSAPRMAPARLAISSGGASEVGGAGGAGVRRGRGKPIAARRGGKQQRRQQQRARIARGGAPRAHPRARARFQARRQRVAACACARTAAAARTGGAPHRHHPAHDCARPRPGGTTPRAWPSRAMCPPSCWRAAATARPRR